MPEAHRALGFARYNLGQYVEAKESYLEAIHLKPDFILAYHDLGMVLCDLGRLPEAIDALNQAIRFQSDFNEAHDTVSYLHSKAGHMNKAVESLKRATKIKPDYAEAYNDLGITSTTWVVIRKPPTPLSARQGSTLNISQAHFNVGIVYARLKKRDSALETYHTLKAQDISLTTTLSSEIFKDKVLIAVAK